MPTLDANGLITSEKAIQLKPYSPRPSIERSYLAPDEMTALAGDVLILDTESYPNYFLAGFKHVKSNRYLLLDGDFNPRFLSWLLFSFKTVGFNSNYYDLGMLWAAYSNRNPEFLKAVSDELIFSGQRIKDVAKKFGFDLYPLPARQHVDLMNVCPGKASLKLYGARLHSPRLQDLPISDEEYLDENQIEIVRQYNCNDLDVTEQVFQFNMERLQLREALSLEYNEDLMSKSDAQMAEAVIPKLVGMMNKKWVKAPEIEPGTVYQYAAPSYLSFATPEMQEVFRIVKNADFAVADDGKMILPREIDREIIIGNGKYEFGIGGLHSKEKCVCYKSNDEYQLIDRDVVSYYPNIILNLKLYPIACGPNFLQVYNGFKAERVVAKRNKNFTKDKGLKIFLNGMSGKFSDRFSKMRSPDQTIQMTVTGQLTLLMLIEMLECNGIQVVSANTDGIVSYVKRTDIEKFNYWTKYWEQLTGYELEETKYNLYAARDVNAYFAVKEDGSVKVKGPYSEVGSQTGTQLDNNPIDLICTDAIKAFLGKGIPIEETVNNCQDITRFIVVRNVKKGAAFRQEYLGKVVRWYKSTSSKDCIHIILNGNKVADSDNCIPVMDLPTIIPDDLDRQFYIDKCKNILYDVGYFQRPRQISFFE